MVNSPLPIIDIDIAYPQWHELLNSCLLMIENAVQLTLEKGIDSQKKFEISFLFTSDEEIQKLNKQYRDKDKPTNVLSFSQIENISEIENMRDPIALGDVILGWETVSWEAADQGKVLAHHLVHLIIHGIMHLIGFDHGDDAAAHEMEALEIDILRQLNIPNPYL